MDDRPPDHVLAAFGLKGGSPEPLSGSWEGGWRCGEIVLSPPSALGDRWSRRFADPLAGFASGWMRIRGRVRQRGVELPLIISDHCDWPELLRTITETGASEVWVTHGREEALVHELSKRQIAARALRLVGREDDAE